MSSQLLSPNEKNLGAFTVKRFLPSTRRQMVGPWIFFDHFGPAQLKPGSGLDVRPHPHINLATVTYLFAGEIIHRDSLGCVQSIRPGEINLMVAGRGIVHSERERPEVRQQSRTLHGVQLWCALPEQDEECDAAFYHYSQAEIPEIDSAGVRVRILIGSAYGVTSPVESFSPTVYATAALSKGQVLMLPNFPETGLYVVSGCVQIEQRSISHHHMMVFSQGQQVEVLALENTQIVIIGGEPIGQRHIDWNFVSSRKERIEQAKRKWRAGSFPLVPGDEEDYIPLAE